MPDHPYNLQSMEALAQFLEATGRSEEAATLRQRILQTQESNLRPEHPDTLKSWNQNTHGLRKIGLFAQAEPIDRRVVAATAKTLGETHPLTLHRRNNLVLDLILQGKLAEARELLGQNWQVKADNFANTTPRIAFLGYVIPARSAPRCSSAS